MLRHRTCAGQRIRIGVAALAAIVGLGALVAPAAVAATTPPADPLGCADQVFDPSSVTGRALATKASSVAISLNADLHVRIEGSLDGDIDGRERRLETGCDGWVGTDGLRATNLLVVMVSPSEHSTSIYYGEDFYDTLSSTDSQIQEYVMNPRFKEGSVEQGLVDGLDAIRVAVRGGGVPQAADPAYGATDFTYTPNYASSSSSSSRDSGVPAGGIVVVIVLFLVIVAFSQWAKSNGWDGASGTGYRRSSSRSSSSRGFSSSSHRSSSSRSSGSSHHSGGGGSSSHW